MTTVSSGQRSSRTATRAMVLVATLLTAGCRSAAEEPIAGLQGQACGPQASCLPPLKCSEGLCQATASPDSGLRWTCAEGETRACYEGAPSTRGRGICGDGKQRCVAGEWTTCAGQLLPMTEACDGLDNDCDGVTDPGCGAGDAGAAAVPPDAQPGPDACQPACVDKACGQPDSCGGTCCAGSGCVVVDCHNDCLTPDTCGERCVKVAEGRSCLGGTCKSGQCRGICPGATNECYGAGSGSTCVPRPDGSACSAGACAGGWCLGRGGCKADGVLCSAYGGPDPACCNGTCDACTSTCCLAGSNCVCTN